MDYNTQAPSQYVNQAASGHIVPNKPITPPMTKNMVNKKDNKDAITKLKNLKDATDNLDELLDAAMSGSMDQEEEQATNQLLSTVANEGLTSAQRRVLNELDYKNYDKEYDPYHEDNWSENQAPPPIPEPPAVETQDVAPPHMPGWPQTQPVPGPIPDVEFPGGAATDEGYEDPYAHSAAAQKIGTGTPIYPDRNNRMQLAQAMINPLIRGEDPPSPDNEYLDINDPEGRLRANRAANIANRPLPKRRGSPIQLGSREELARRPRIYEDDPTPPPQQPVPAAPTQVGTGTPIYPPQQKQGIWDKTSAAVRKAFAPSQPSRPDTTVMSQQAADLRKQAVKDQVTPKPAVSRRELFKQAGYTDQQIPDLARHEFATRIRPLRDQTNVVLKQLTNAIKSITDKNIQVPVENALRNAKLIYENAANLHGHMLRELASIYKLSSSQKRIFLESNGFVDYIIVEASPSPAKPSIVPPAAKAPVVTPVAPPAAKAKPPAQPAAPKMHQYKFTDIDPNPTKIKWVIKLIDAAMKQFESLRAGFNDILQLVEIDNAGK